MKHKIISLALGTVLVLIAVGCGTATTPTPLPTQPPQVITVIITATPPPPTATSAAPTVTPMPTLPLTSTVSAATPTQAVAKVATPRPAASRTPTKPAVAPTATALAIKFGAPSIIRPRWDDDLPQHDEVKYSGSGGSGIGSAIILDWLSVGGLSGDECYLVNVTTEPINPGPGIGVASDYWVTNCGDQTQTGALVKTTNSLDSFTLESPNRVGSLPNYGSLILNTDMWATWTVTVVKNLGECDPSYKYHCKTRPISPPGYGKFKFKSG